MKMKMQKYEIQQLNTSIHTTSLNSTQRENVNNSLDQNSSHHNYEFMIQQLTVNHNTKTKRKFGNIKVLFQNSKFLFTIGPDYICFIFGFIFFLMTHFAINLLVLNTIQNQFVIISSLFFSFMQCFSYIFVALSNPGIQTKYTLPTQEDNPQEQVKRFCKICAIKMQEGTFHCRQCDVCIREYDHHCPWVSKCIGQKNLSKFYFFTITTMFYFVYCIIIVIVCLAKNASNVNLHPKNKFI